MKRLALLGACAVVLFALPEAVEASGDYGCDLRWTISSPSLECANRVVLSPGNDTRVNLLLLLRDRAGLSAPGGRSYAPADYFSSEFGRVFLTWNRLKLSYFPESETLDESTYGGSRCNSLSSGGEAYAGALAASAKVDEADRQALAQARSQLSTDCDPAAAERAWPSGIGSRIGRDFLTYLVGAAAFYDGRFDEARTAFGLLKQSRDPWVGETAAYMLARNELAAAQAPAFDEWGDYLGSSKTDKTAARNGQQALAAYLDAYPQGRYAASARGLQRRALWLLGDRRELARAYAALVSDTSGETAALAALVEEVDSKLLFAPGMTGEIDTPLLLATWDLWRMRGEAEYFGESPPPITAAEIASQQPLFAGSPELFSFVAANHAFYVAKDYRKVVELLPDDARRPSYSALAFSRQVLRGLALEALGDRNATGFWLELVGGSRDLYQRPLVELALAMSWERHAALAKVFAADSAVSESEIRIRLLQHSAGEALLRAQAGRGDRPARERDAALFMLLYKELAYGRYGGFLGDLALVAADAPKDGSLGSWLDPEVGGPPVGLFASGIWSEAYACPALAQTAMALSRNARDSHALLCLGEFYRLNGFDGFMTGDERPETDELGGVANEFGGTVATRQGFYQRVIADRSAAPEDRAYALYRAVWCYGPGGNNSCGGEEVATSQRRAWFMQLKRDYPASRWAKDLKYYW